MKFSGNRFLKILTTGFTLSFDQSDIESQVTTRKQARRKVVENNPGIFCRRCNTKVTTQSKAVELHGLHFHVFTNPEGITFEIGLFDQAECAAISPATLEHTWFAGFAWQVVICRTCQAHIGWRYSKPQSPIFYGLIMDRLVEQAK
jgi:ribosomal protein L40E